MEPFSRGGDNGKPRVTGDVPLIFLVSVETNLFYKSSFHHRLTIRMVTSYPCELWLFPVHSREDTQFCLVRGEFAMVFYENSLQKDEYFFHITIYDLVRTVCTSVSTEHICFEILFSGGSRIFPRGVRQLPKVLLFFNFFLKTACK